MEKEEKTKESPVTVERSEKSDKYERQEKTSEFLEELIKIGRIVKVTKGGRKFRFSAMLAIGDGNTRVGVGHGKAKEIPDATQKAITMAKKRMLTIYKKNKTIPYEIFGKFGSTSVMLRPAKPGTGVIAGGVVRAVVSKVGIQDIFSKVHGSKNPTNVVYATIDALKKIQNPLEIAKKRGKRLSEIFQ